MKGKLFAISGPSGVGKNSVLNRVMQLRDRVQYSVSATSRPMRPGEIDGKSYYFVTREQFEQMIAAGELLEHAEYVGNYYGTPLKPIQAALAAGTDVVMDVDVVGALNIKKRLPEAVLVFMAAPSMAEIRRRLASRGDVSPELMEKRMDRAKWEYSQAGQYDYLVVNDTVEHAAQELLAIMTAEKCKMMDRIHCIKEELLCFTPPCRNFSRMLTAAICSSTSSRTAPVSCPLSPSSRTSRLRKSLSRSPSARSLPASSRPSLTINTDTEHPSRRRQLACAGSFEC